MIRHLIPSGNMSDKTSFQLLPLNIKMQICIDDLKHTLSSITRSKDLKNKNKKLKCIVSSSPTI